MLGNYEWVPWITGGLTGGLAGAILTALVTRRRARMEGSLRLLDQYVSRFTDLETVFNLLGDRTSFSDENPNRVKNANRVRFVGDWMEIVAMLYVRKHVDRSILSECGLIALIRDFRAYLLDYGKPASQFIEGWHYIRALEGYPHGSPSKAKIGATVLLSKEDHS